MRPPDTAMSAGQISHPAPTMSTVIFQLVQVEGFEPPSIPLIDSVLQTDVANRIYLTCIYGGDGEIPTHGTD